MWKTHEPRGPRALLIHSACDCLVSPVLARPGGPGSIFLYVARTHPGTVERADISCCAEICTTMM